MNLKQFLFLLICLSMTLFYACKDENSERDIFLGTYETIEDCEGSGDNYEIKLTNGSEIDELTFFNLYNIGVSFSAIIDGNNISFNEIVTDGAYGAIFDGTATLEGDIMNINFTIVNGGDTFNCTAVATRK